MQDTKSESTSNDETVSSAEDFVMDVEYTLQERLRDVQDKQEDISVEEPDENSSDLFWSPPIFSKGENPAVHAGEDVTIEKAMDIKREVRTGERDDYTENEAIGIIENVYNI